MEKNWWKEDIPSRARLRRRRKEKSFCSKRIAKFYCVKYISSFFLITKFIPSKCYTWMKILKINLVYLFILNELSIKSDSKSIELKLFTLFRILKLNSSFVWSYLFCRIWRRDIFSIRSLSLFSEWFLII